jgi:hypothetical protein
MKADLSSTGRRTSLHEACGKLNLKATLPRDVALLTGLSGWLFYGKPGDVAKAAIDEYDRARKSEVAVFDSEAK